MSTAIYLLTLAQRQSFPVDVYFRDTIARLWTCDLAYPLRIFAGHTAGVNVAQFHPNGKYIVTGSSDHTCRLWDIHNGQCVRLLAGKKSAVNSVVFHPNGKQVLTTGGDGVVYVCSGAVVREYRDHRGGVCDMCCSGDGGLLVTAGSSDHTLRVWNLNSTASPTETEPLSSVSIPDSSILGLQFTHRNYLKVLASHTSQKEKNLTVSVLQSVK